MNTRKDSSVVQAIINQMVEFRPSEKKVAKFVASCPEDVIRMSISTLAQRANVSEPTVLRFCRRIAFSGFTDLKIALATDMASGTPFVDEEVTMTDSPQRVGEKLVGSAIQQLSLVNGQLDYESMIRAAAAIQSARRIDLCGIAQSTFVAAEFQHRLVRMGYSAIAMPDTHMQLQAAASLAAGDVALVMSFAGQIKETVSVARLAKRVGATVIVVSRSTSALAREADILINVDSDEKTFVYTSSATRIAHLVVVDILTSMLALNAGEEMIDRLRRSRLATKEHWIPGMPD